MLQARVASIRASSLVWVFYLALSTIGCNDEGTNNFITDGNGIAVLVGQSSISVYNNTLNTIHIFAVEKRASELVEWIQGCDSSSAITSGSVKEIPYSKIYSYYKGCESYVFWWNCDPFYDHRLHSIFIKTL
jgi:hypothetical protein